MSTDPKSQAAPPSPKCALIVMCVECSDGAPVSLPMDREALALTLARRGWFEAVVPGPPGQGPEVPILLGALCGACAPKIFPPEVLKGAEDRRQKIVQGIR